MPYESSCRRLPLWPLKTTLTYPVDGVVCIRIDNVPTRILSRFSGGYDYAVSYLIDETLMVDTGFPWARRQLKRTLIELNATETISQVVNTHYHEDHTGNNDLLVEMTGAKILAHAIALPEIRFPVELPWYRRFLFGPYVPVDVHPIGDVVTTSQYRFEVHHMPGHCPGHVCLFEPDQRWLFSGDLYIAADLDSQLGDANGPEWIESLDRAIELRPRCLFDAHGTVIVDEESVATFLRRKREFLSKIRDRVFEFATSAQTIQELTRKVFDRRRFVDYLSLDDGWLSLITGSDFSRGNIVKSFLRDAKREA